MKLAKIKTIYGEVMILEIYSNPLNYNYINTSKGRIDKSEIEEFAIIGDSL